MKKRPDITDQTKNNLKTAFWKLYEYQSIEHITVKQITDLAGYNRGTFYLNFKDTHDILEQVEDMVLSDFEEHLKPVLENFKDFKMADLMKHVLAMYNLNNEHISILLSEHANPRFEVRFRKMTKEFLRISIQSDINENDLIAEYRLEFFVSGLIGAVKRWQNHNQDLPVESFSQMVMDFYFNNFQN